MLLVSSGLEGSVSTNHQAIEIQLMRKFLSTQQVQTVAPKNTDSTPLINGAPFPLLSTYGGGMKLTGNEDRTSTSEPTVVSANAEGFYYTVR